MQQNISLRILPSQAASHAVLTQLLAEACAINANSITGFNILKQSIDARGKTAFINLTVQVFINEPYQSYTVPSLQLRPVHHAKHTVVIVGAGPAGLFAALQLMELGIKPIILERGKDVRSRRRDLAAINKSGIVNSESNYCFGEGGAGTYSDGKLYTRSNKRGNVQRILSILVHFGATEKILYEAHPHIGTNKLPNIITAMRQAIIEYGGAVHFEQKLTGFIRKQHIVTAVQTATGATFAADAVILATGHSARDVFELLHQHNILIEAKPFALGVRVEHPQVLIDQIQYHTNMRSEFLPPASYSVVQQVEGRGVFSFCMCPGGIIAPAATSPNEIVVNGWSPSKRNNPFANSGIVVSVTPQNWQQFSAHGPLAAMYFQQWVEQKAFAAGGGNLVAPAQRLIDFCENKLSASLPRNSYLPGLQSVMLQQVLPAFVHESLQAAFKAFGKKMNGYFTNEAVVVATESRTSSPVRIPRDKMLLHHPQIKNLYPCGEGAGFAGGIVSAAMDGERIAVQVAAQLG